MQFLLISEHKTFNNLVNNCATNTNDPITGFPTTNSVWFEFVPNDSRNIKIEVESDAAYPLGVDPIDPEIAVFYAPTNQCTDGLIEVANQNSESLELNCLNTKLTYYILIDGRDANPTGIFSVKSFRFRLF